MGSKFHTTLSILKDFQIQISHRRRLLSLKDHHCRCSYLFVHIHFTQISLVFDSRASFVVCPCCYGSINDIQSVSYPRSKKFREKIAVKDYLILSRSSDMTTWDEKSTNCRLGQSSMALVDLDRCSFMEEHGYETSLRIMMPKSCSPKNHLLIGAWTHSESEN